MKRAEDQILLCFVRIPDPKNPLSHLLLRELPSLHCGHEGRKIHAYRVLLIPERVLCAAIREADELMIVNFSNDWMSRREVVPMSRH